MGWLALRRRTRQGAPESLLLWAPGVILAFAVLIPVVTLVLELTSGEDGMSGVAAILLEPDVWLLLAGSVALATAVTMLATLLAVPLGVLLGRTDVGGRGWLLAVHAFPMFVPPFLVALGWFHIVGANGYLGTPSTARLFFGPVGVVAVLGLTLAPIITSLTALALQNVDPSLEDAGRVAGGPVRVIARILLPTAWPAVALGLLLVFALALSELAVPMFLRVRTYPASVFARLGGIDYAPGEAVALALPLLAVTLGLLALERRLVGPPGRLQCSGCVAATENRFALAGGRRRLRWRARSSPCCRWRRYSLWLSGRDRRGSPKCRCGSARACGIACAPAAWRPRRSLRSA